jgi:hypothetical protein
VTIPPIYKNENLAAIASRVTHNPLFCLLFFSAQVMQQMNLKISSLVIESAKLQMTLDIGETKNLARSLLPLARAHVIISQNLGKKEAARTSILGTRFGSRETARRVTQRESSAAQN